MRRVMVMLWLFAAVLPGTLATLLLFVAVTWRGHFFAFVALGLLALPLVWISKLGTTRKAIATAVELVLIAVLAITAPRIPDFIPGQLGLSQLGGGSRISLFAWLPELDQMVLGTWPVQLIDRALDDAHARRLRNLLPEVYGDLRLMGSMLGLVQDPPGQTFIIVPPHGPAERLPLVIFLHGSGGAFVAYQARLSSWATTGRFVVVSPGFGVGNWQNPGGVETIEAARAFAEASLPVDPSRVAVVGLSNGGRGLTRLIAQGPTRRWKLIVALSAVLEEDLVTEAWAGRDVLVLHGADDEQIPSDSVNQVVQTLVQRGAHPSEKVWPAEDHFLWFSRPAEIQTRALVWLTARWARPAQ